MPARGPAAQPVMTAPEPLASQEAGLAAFAEVGVAGRRRAGWPAGGARRAVKSFTNAQETGEVRGILLLGAER
jgi:hypothetical protein